MELFSDLPPVPTARQVQLAKGQVYDAAYQALPDGKIKKAAQNKVTHSIIKRDLVRPDRCNRCDHLCKPDAHHGIYDIDRRLDVIWLCKVCHKRRHLELISGLELEPYKPRQSDLFESARDATW